MLNKFRYSTVFSLIFFISNLSLIDEALASKIKDLKGNYTKVITQDSIINKSETLSIYPGLNSIKSDLFFQNQNYKEIILKQYQFTISQSSALREAAEQFKRKITSQGGQINEFVDNFVKTSEITKIIQSNLEDLSDYPGQLELTTYNREMIDRTLATEENAWLSIGTFSLATVGGVYLCVNEDCFELKKE